MLEQEIRAIARRFAHQQAVQFARNERQFVSELAQEAEMTIVAEWIDWALAQADMYQQLASELLAQEAWDALQAVPSYCERLHCCTIPAVAHPVLICAWCWRVRHPFTPFPEAWSSTICEEHSEWMIEQAKARRQRV